MLYSFKVGSITNAQRSAGIFRAHGMRAAISRINNPQPSEGCGYVVNVRTSKGQNVRKLLDEAGITVYGVDIT